MKKIIEILTWDLTTYKHNYMLQLLGVFGIMLAIMVLPEFGSGSSCGNINFVENMFEYVQALNTFVTCIYMTLLSAPLDGKQQRISYIMLPASLRQKLMARLIIVLVLVPLALTVCTMVADMIQMVLYFMITNGVQPHSYMVFFIENITSEFSKLIDDYGGFSDLISLIIICGFIGFFVCFGLMCGALWTRKAFLKSIGLGFAFSFVVIIACTVFTSTGLNFYWIMNPATCTDVSMIEVYEVLSLLWILFLYALDAALLWKGYNTFVNRQQETGTNFVI